MAQNHKSPVAATEKSSSGALIHISMQSIKKSQSAAFGLCAAALLSVASQSTLAATIWDYNFAGPPPSLIPTFVAPNFSASTITFGPGATYDNTRTGDLYI